MPHRLNIFIESNPNLRSLAQASVQISLLQRHFLAILPAPLNQHCRVVRFAQGDMTLEADNGAVAGKLRQLVPQLISSFRTRGCEVTGIQIRVQASNIAPPAPVRQRLIGTQGRRSLEDFARSLPDDNPLKSSLQRMAHKKG